MIFSLPQLIAQSITNPALNSYGDMSATQFLGGLIPALIALGLVIGAVVFLFYFLMGAISWITSGGDKMKLEQARNRIITAIVGLVILLSFFGILNLVEAFFGIGLRGIEVGPFHIELTGGGGTNGSPTTSCSTLGQAPPCGSNCQVCTLSNGQQVCWSYGNCPN